jgi:hypothetical protein
VERGPFRGLILFPKSYCSKIVRKPLPLAGPLLHAFAGKGRRRNGKADGGGTAQRQPFLTPSAWPPDLASSVNHGRPKRPQKNHVNKNENAMQPSDPLGMKGQKLHLDQQQKENRADDKRYPGDSIREESQPAPAQALRPREKLDKNIGRKLPPQIFLGFLRIAELRLELPVEHADLRGQHDEMHERIGMRNNENDRRQNKKGDKRQWHIAHKRQFNGIFQEKIFMCHGASRDADVNQYEEIAQPQTCADRGGTVHSP